CSRNYCKLVPKITAVYFPEITALLIPVYTRTSRMGSRSNPLLGVGVGVGVKTIFKHFWKIINGQYDE
ncbi:MAG: hypothetical protein JW830_01855, partial [Bacteroidales bacterium]|nr:hypothetical protein [Bacteroidales bacterium]